MLAEAALVSFRMEGVNGPRTLRDGLEFFVADRRAVSELVYTEKSSVQWHLEPEVVKKALLGANRTVELVHDVAASNNAPIFELLGLRNLSSFVGEIFAGALNEFYVERFLRNPNQDGHPDLMALTPEGQRYIGERTSSAGLDRDKRHWSPYPFGGVEVKATCGNTPSARKVAKPRIGEARIHDLTATLIRLAGDFARRQLKTWNVSAPTGDLAACHAYLAHRKLWRKKV